VYIYGVCSVVTSAVLPVCSAENAVKSAVYATLPMLANRQVDAVFGGRCAEGLMIIIIIIIIINRFV